MGITLTARTTPTPRRIHEYPGGADARIVDAALACFARFGVTKTTFEDIAQEAGCARATLYRYFGGKQDLLAGVVRAEVRRLGTALEDELADAQSLEEVVVRALTLVGREFAAHDALRHILEVEPEVILPHVAFDGAHRIFATASALLAPHLGRFLPPEEAVRASEWLCRLACAYLFSPSETVSLSDEESVRRFVRRFVLPGLEPGEAPNPGGGDL